MTREARLVKTPDYYYNKGKQYQSQLKSRGITKPLWECISDVRAMDKALESTLDPLRRLKLK